MTPNRTLRNDRDAQVGIGTMIVFIATILVAAVAAGVLIDTSQKLQDKSTRTGTEATQNVGTSLTVEKALGSRNDAVQAGLEQIDIYVVLSAGADPLDLDDLVIHYNDGQAVSVFSLAVAVSATEYTATWIRGTGTGNVMEAGDLVLLTIGEAAAAPTYDVELTPNTQVDVNLLPSQGNDVSFGFQSPATYAQKTTVGLF